MVMDETLQLTSSVTGVTWTTSDAKIATVDANGLVTAVGAGDVTITAYANGQPIPGITATETITTAETEIRTITLHGIVRVRCEPIAITLVNESEVAIATSNVALSVIRID
jgi:hypothetical protein